MFGTCVQTLASLPTPPPPPCPFCNHPFCVMITADTNPPPACKRTKTLIQMTTAFQKQPRLSGGGRRGLKEGRPKTFLCSSGM